MQQSLSAVRRTRHQLRYLRKQTARRARSWFINVPAARQASRSLWVCSWQRSGSTWLAEMLASSPGTRLVYEPANVPGQIFDGVRAAAVTLPTEGAEAEISAVIDALLGRLRGPWVDQLNEAHVIKRRVVKDVRALSLAAEVHTALPHTPVVVLVRHPIAVARSTTRLGWNADADAAASFHLEVTSWCERHQAVFADERLRDAHFVAYESLVAHPLDELRRIVTFASSIDPSWLHLDLSRVNPRAPSATTFADGTTEMTPGDWGDLPNSLISFARGELERHGLLGLYNETSACQSEIRDFVVRFRQDRTTP